MEQTEIQLSGTFNYRVDKTVYYRFLVRHNVVVAIDSYVGNSESIRRFIGKTVTLKNGRFLLGHMRLDTEPLIA